MKTLKNDVPDQNVISVFSHILASERLWVARIRGLDTSGMEIWPDLNLDDCDDWLLENRQMLNELSTNLADSDYSTVITYKNSKNITYHNSVYDIMTHVSLHNTYHRGQIAGLLRQQMINPPNIDYITYIRDGG